MNKQYKDIIFVGLTGQTGAGKTTAGEFFVDNGYGVINCDHVSRTVTSDGSHCLADLVLEFSDAILKKDGKLDRTKLAEIVFNDNIKLLRLNEIIFPYILEKIKSVAQALIESGFKVIVFDAPTLFESELDTMCDVIISIVADQKVRLDRIMARDSISSELANARINSQYDDIFFASKSDRLIKNNGSHSDFIKQLNEIAEFITSYKKVV